MTTGALPRQLLLQPMALMVVAASAIVWLLPGAFEGAAMDRTAADLAARAALMVRLLEASPGPVTPETAERLCKAAYQSTATRFTVFHLQENWTVDAIDRPSRGIDWLGFPEVREAASGGVARRLIQDRYLEERQMAVVVPSAPHAPGMLVRASASLDAQDRAMGRLRLALAAGLGALIGIWGIYGYRMACVFRCGIDTVGAALTRFGEGAFTPVDCPAVGGKWAVLFERLNRSARALSRRFQAVEHRRDELETVLSSMREGVFAVGPDEQILNINRAAADMFDTDPDTAAGKSIQEVIRNLALQRFVTRASTLEVSLEEDVTLYKGETVILNLRSSAMKDAEDRRIGTLIVMADVTRLRHLEEMRSDFVANVSHEIRTPLTAIKGFVETLYNRQVASPEESERFLRIIVKHVDRLDAIVTDLLSLSKIERSQGRQELQLKETRIRDVIATALQVVQAKADAKQIQLTVTDSEGARAVVDATLLEQALLNLVDNAIKYSGPGGRVEVAATTRNGELRIQVIDQGVGIAKGHLPRLFERFYRVDKARSRHIGGTGLGLAIVKHITQAHGGQVTVNSTPGKGTTFTLQLPVG